MDGHVVEKGSKDGSFVKLQVINQNNELNNAKMLQRSKSSFT